MGRSSRLKAIAKTTEPVVLGHVDAADLAPYREAVARSQAALDRVRATVEWTAHVEAEGVAKYLSEGLIKKYQIPNGAGLNLDTGAITKGKP